MALPTDPAVRRAYTAHTQLVHAERTVDRRTVDLQRLVGQLDADQFAVYATATEAWRAAEDAKEVARRG